MPNAQGPVRAKKNVSEPSPLAPRRTFYTQKEMAADVWGVDYIRTCRPGWLDRKYNEGCPRPYQENPRRWDRLTVDLWKGRHRPGAAQTLANAPANDDAPAMAGSEDEQRARFHAFYGHRG